MLSEAALQIGSSKANRMSSAVTTWLLVAMMLGITWSLLNVRRRAQSRQKHFPQGMLPSATPFPLCFTTRGLLLHPLAWPHDTLPCPFYDRERIDYHRRFLVKPLVASCPLPPVKLVFLAHLSRCGTTLLTRILDAHPDAVCYREPSILSEVMWQVALASNEAARRQRLQALRGLLALFAAHTLRQRRTVTIVKLASVTTFRECLAGLQEAAPAALRVYVSRNPAAVAHSHQRSGSVPPRTPPDARGVSSVRRHLEEKADAARVWSQREIQYSHFADATPVCLKWLCATCNLSEPSDSQQTDMFRIRRLDAKTGKPREEGGARVDAGP